MNKKIEMLQHYVKMVAKGYYDSLIVTGKAGIGKSYNIINTLKRNNINYIYHSGFKTPLALYNFLYKYKDKLIIFDDTEGIMNNNIAMSLLNSALWVSNDEKIISWESSTNKLNAPQSFVFEGKIIFICNRIPRNNVAMRSRCIVYNLNFTHDEIISIMRKIAQKRNKLNPKTRLMIVKFIEKHSHKYDINLRVQKIIESMYLYNKNKWKELALNIITSLPEKSEKLITIEELIKSGMTTSEQIDIWMKKGWSRRSYFYYKKKVI